MAPPHVHWLVRMSENKSKDCGERTEQNVWSFSLQRERKSTTHKGDAQVMYPHTNPEVGKHSMSPLRTALYQTHQIMAQIANLWDLLAKQSVQILQMRVIERKKLHHGLSPCLDTRATRVLSYCFPMRNQPCSSKPQCRRGALLPLRGNRAFHSSKSNANLIGVKPTLF